MDHIEREHVAILRDLACDRLRNGGLDAKEKDKAFKALRALWPALNFREFNKEDALQANLTSQWDRRAKIL